MVGSGIGLLLLDLLSSALQSAVTFKKPGVLYRPGRDRPAAAILERIFFKKMRKWTKKRKNACIRDSKGRFKKWKGGLTKAQLKKKRNTYQGIAIHIGKEYRRQHGRPARVGGIVRKRRKDGGYHRGADWYVRTRHGWRDTGSPIKPTRAKIKRICARARPGR